MNIATRILDFLQDYKFIHEIKGFGTKLFRKPKSPGRINPNEIKRYYVISRNPLIISTVEPFHHLEEISRLIGDQKAYFLVMFWGNFLYNERKILYLKKSYKQFTQRYPHHKVFFLANTEEEQAVLNSFNHESHFINHNCLLDPNLFRPIHSEKRIDLIYNGRLEVVKRHYLIPENQSVGLISGAILNSKKAGKLLTALRRNIPNALVLNFNPHRPLGGFTKEDFREIPNLSSEEICILINQCKIGLILSAVEGANYASMEYLMCGVPVVSTISLGGRHVFFDGKYCRITKSNSGAILKAINEVMAAGYTAEEIRDYALLAIQPHLDRYKTLLAGILSENGFSISPENLWSQVYTNKMLKFHQGFDEEKFRNEISSAPDLAATSSIIEEGAFSDQNIASI